MNWLEKHDPDISFRNKTVTKRTRYNNRLIPPKPRKGPACALPQRYTPPSYTLAKDPTIEAGNADSRTVGRILAAATKVMSSINDEVRGEFPKKSSLPAYYKDYADVFSEEASHSLPDHRGELDHAIDFIANAKLPHPQLARKTATESRVERDWLTASINNGWMRASKSPLATPLVFAKKKDTHEICVCNDLRSVNKITIKNREPLPLFDNLIEQLQGIKYFTTLDLRWAFHRIQICEGNEWKTAFISRYRLYEWLVMPFGLCNALATFQRFINSVMGEQIDRELVAFFDDILIFGNTLEELRERTRRCLQRLCENQLFCNLKKCRFEVQTVRFLGHIVEPGKIRMDPEKLDSILNWPTPKSIKDVRSFTGFTGYYRSFIKDYSKITARLTDLTKGNPPKFRWGLAEEEAFQRLKKAFIGDKILRQFDPNLAAFLETDVSGYAIAGILS